MDRPNGDLAGSLTHTLADALRAEAQGAPVFLTVQKDGIWAHTPDRAFGRRLVAGRPLAAAWDAPAELLWYVEGTHLRVVDLRAAGNAPVDIVDGLALPGFTILRGNEVAATSGWISDVMSIPYTTMVTLGATPKLGFELHSTTADEATQAGARGQFEKARLVGKDWLVRQAGRTVRDLPRLAAEPRDRVPLPPGMGECQAQTVVCGDATAFGKSNLVLVVAAATYTTSAYTSEYRCTLYDPGKKAFADPLEPSVWGAAGRDKLGPCGPYHLSGSGATLLVGDRLCEESKCRALPGRALGWLDSALEFGRSDGS